MRMPAICFCIAVAAMVACKPPGPPPPPTPVPTEAPTEVPTMAPPTEVPTPVNTPVPNPNPCKKTGVGADGILWKGDCEVTSVCRDLGGNAFVGDCHTRPMP